MDFFRNITMQSLHKDPYLYFHEYQNISNDFVGISLNLGSIGRFLLILCITLFLFSLYSLLGWKVLAFLHFTYRKFTFFISLGIGFVLITSGICILGMVSLLYINIVVFFFLTVILFCTYPFPDFISESKKILDSIIQSIRKRRKISFLQLATFSVIVIAFLRLIPPDVNLDALSYHTDFPRLYVKHHSIILPNKGNEVFITIPQLGELQYVLMEMSGLREGSKYIHFGFYFLIILLLMTYIKNQKEYYLLRFVPFLFASAPIVFHIASSAYGDFPALFCFFISFVLISDRKIDSKKTILAGILMGGMLASKIWALFFLPVFVIFILCINGVKTASFKYILLFVIAALSISGIWYIRSFIIAGDPFYHNEDFIDLKDKRDILSFKDYFFVYFSIRPEFITDYSALNIIGFVGLCTYLKKIIFRIKDSRFFYFLLVLLIEFSFIPVFFMSRYFLPFYLFLAMVYSIGIVYLIKKISIMKYVVKILIIFSILLYIFNTIPLLFYGFGLSNTEKYLSRVVLPYYDYNKIFSKQISSNETVATYGVYGYYYANFNYKNVFYFFNTGQRKVAFLKHHNINKLLLKGGDFMWFCHELHVADCKKTKIKELAKHTSSKQYLYKLE